MNYAHLTGALDSLTPAQMRDMLSYLSGWDPKGFGAALASIQPPEPEIDPALLSDALADDLPDSALLPAADYIRDTAAELKRRAHGENHIDNAGHVVFSPGDCITCHGHATADGIFHPAQAAS